MKAGLITFTYIHLALLTIVGFGAAAGLAAQESLPRLEPAECFIERSDWARDAKIDCKWLVVPEDHANPRSRSIKLAVVIVRATEPDGTVPLVFLHGGPGDSAIRFMRGIIERKFNQHRDVVLYDQRGAGFSEPQLCPEYKEVEKQSLKLTTEEAKSLLDEGACKCIASLDKRIERSAYSTIASTDDMVDLRRCLGFNSWDVFAISYGGRLAQEAMRRDAKAIHAMVFFRPMTRGPTREAEAPLSNQRAFERVFNDCKEQPECRAKFPTLENDFYEVYDDLNKTPLLVQIDQDSDNGPFVLDGKQLYLRIRNDFIAKGIPDRLSRIPLLINEFRRGDKIRAARVLIGSDPWAVIGGNVPLLRLMSCNDVYGNEVRAKLKTINAQVRPLFRRFVMDECKLWQKHFAAPSEWEPVRSDIPTLILTGRYDDRTPTEHAKLIASTLTRAYLYEFPNEAHGPAPSACQTQIVQQFFANPFREPDASCIKQIQAIKFLTEWDEAKPPQNASSNKRP